MMKTVCDDRVKIEGGSCDGLRMVGNVVYLRIMQE